MPSLTTRRSMTTSMVCFFCLSSVGGSASSIVCPSTLARFDGPPVPVGKDGVKGERRVARSRNAGNDDEFVARNDDVDVPKVVLACTADDDGVHSLGGLRGLVVARPRGVRFAQLLCYSTP